MTPNSPEFRYERAARLVIGGLLCLAFPLLFLLAVHGAGPAPDAGYRFLGVALGIVGGALGFVYRHPFRVLGLVPIFSLGWLGLATYGVAMDIWPGWAHGMFFGLNVVALHYGWTKDARAFWEKCVIYSAAILGFVMAGLFANAILPPEWAKWYALGILGLLVLAAWVFLLRPVTELAVEPVLWLMYKIRGAGPGLTAIHHRGPCLVVANHACWFDPLFLAKVLPRPITPMMTALFYDLPVMRWFMRHVFHTIRVPDRALKQDVPEEIQQAIAALDRGECVVIFPEGYLRRSEEKPLKRFGRGVWQILAARPETPVFACWIEGGWGSYCSYFNGKPTKNKKPDFRRPIGVAVTGPIAVDADTLGEHLRTRLFLMNRVAEARKELGLAELATFELPTRDDENVAEDG